MTKIAFGTTFLQYVNELLILLAKKLASFNTNYNCSSPKAVISLPTVKHIFKMLKIFTYLLRVIQVLKFFQPLQLGKSHNEIT